MSLILSATVKDAGSHNPKSLYLHVEGKNESELLENLAREMLVKWPEKAMLFNGTNWVFFHEVQNPKKGLLGKKSLKTGKHGRV